MNRFLRSGPAAPLPADVDHLPSRQRRAFQLAQAAARTAVQRRFRVIRLTKDAYAKLERHESSLAQAARDLRSLVHLARAWAVGEYRDLPWRSIVFVVAAIIYFVNPVDLIPDVLTGIGFIDDAAVIGAVVRSLSDDLSAFRTWQGAQAADRDGAMDGAASEPTVHKLHASAAA